MHNDIADGQPQAPNQIGQAATPRVAVVVTTLNEARTIDALMHALAAQTRPADEIILVDGGSTDGTIAIIRDLMDQLPNMRLIVAQDSNISSGRNQAIAAATCPIIAVTDAGCVPAPAWLEYLLAPFEEQAGIDLVCGAYHIAPRSDFEDCVGRCSATGWLRLQGQIVRPTARSLAFTKAAWHTVGGFPEWLYAGEDIRFVLVSIREGYQLREAASAIVDWRPRASYSDVFRQFHIYARDTTRGGLTWRIYSRTLIQDVILTGLVLWGLVFPNPLPWLLLVCAIVAYLYRKARHGCFDTPGWRTYYRVPLILSTIHAGVLSGIVTGLGMRIWNRR